MTVPAPQTRASLGEAILDWLRLAAHPGTVRRAGITALVVGGILIAINHGQAILSGNITCARWIQMCLTAIVPYIVSTTSSVSTHRELSAIVKQ